MLSHIHIGVTDFERAFDFYSAIFEPLGLVLKFREENRPWAGWMSPNIERPLFLIGAPFDGGSHACGNGQMIALLAHSRRTVDECHASALVSGGTCAGSPGLRPEYHSTYYGAYFKDPDSNKLCVCFHGAE